MALSLQREEELHNDLGKVRRCNYSNVCEGLVFFDVDVFGDGDWRAQRSAGKA